MKQGGRSGRAGVLVGLFALAVATPSCGGAGAPELDEDDVMTSEGALTPDAHVSMLFVSDVHFGADGPMDAATAGGDADDAEEELDEREDAKVANLTVVQKNAAFVSAIERLSSAAWAKPLAAVHVSNAFDGLVVTGDVTDDGQPAQWRAFLEGYEDRLKPLGIPVYETAGNHDYPFSYKKPEPGRPSDYPVISRIVARGSNFSNHSILLPLSKAPWAATNRPWTWKIGSAWISTSPP